MLKPITIKFNLNRYNDSIIDKLYVANGNTFVSNKLKEKKIIAKINAFHPNPGCWFSLMGSRIKIIKAEEVTLEGPPGEILDNSFTIGCSENAVKIVELKKEGKQIVNAIEFLKGNTIKVGYNLNKDDQLSN